MNAISAHGGQLVQPESMPSGIAAGIRDTRVEAGLDRQPSLRLAKSVSQSAGVEVGEAIAERLTDSVEQILSVDERDRALGRGFRGQKRPTKK